MHVLKYCCFFDNSIWFKKCQKTWKNNTWNPKMLALVFFTNHLKLVNLIPKHQFSEAATLAVAQSWPLGSQIADKKNIQNPVYLEMFIHIQAYSIMIVLITLTPFYLHALILHTFQDMFIVYNDVNFNVWWSLLK